MWSATKQALAVLAIVTGVMVLDACEQDAMEAARPPGSAFVVEKLFTHDGCTVYRFSDGSHSRYFARCGSTASTSWSESCGKNCTRPVTLPTAADK